MYDLRTQALQLAPLSCCHVCRHPGAVWCGCRAAAKRRKGVTWNLDAGPGEGLRSRHADSAAAAVEEERAARRAAAAWYSGPPG